MPHGEVVMPDRAIDGCLTVRSTVRVTLAKSFRLYESARHRTLGAIAQP